MRDRLRILTIAIGLAILVAGGALLGSGLGSQSRSVVLSADVTFPDFSSAGIRDDSVNGVIFRLYVTTAVPWIQGREQNLQATLEAQPGPGVRSVSPTTLFLYLARPSVRGFVTGDLNLLRATGPNRWVPTEGPLRIWPNLDVTGSDFYLTFAISLNVEYADGSSYGYGGWNPGARLFPVSIVPDLTTYGSLVIAVGGSIAFTVALKDRLLARRHADRN